MRGDSASTASLPPQWLSSPLAGISGFAARPYGPSAFSAAEPKTALLRTDLSTDEAWRRKSELHAGLHYLTGEVISLGGLRFWGGPWYSDLFGGRNLAYLHDIEQLLNDFSARHNDAGRWTVARHRKEHARQTQLLCKEAGHVDVVITHWPPTIHAVAPQDEGDLLNGYYVNDREDLVEEIGAQCWISGHVHDAYRTVVGDTLVIGNPAGYPQEKPERRLFRPDLAIEVKPGARTELAE